MHQSPLEFWHVLQIPAANPELFLLLSRPEFVVDGNPRPAKPYHWTRFAAASIEDELKLRQSAMGKAIPGVQTNSLFLLRAVWRTLQLLVVQRSSRQGSVQIPLTPAAIRRGIQAWGVPDLPILRNLHDAYQDELQGQASNAAQLIPEAMAMFQNLTGATAPEASRV
jgi:hypothetical protein